MNIAFFGIRNYFSTTILQNLIQILPIKLLVLPYVSPTPPPTVAIQLRLRQSDIRKFNSEFIAEQSDINILYHADLTEQQLASELKAHSIDLIIVGCYSRLISDIQINACKFGAINIHPSLLPAYRGPTPIFWQLRNNEQNTGVSLHSVTNCFDAGNVIAQKSIQFPVTANSADIDRLVASTAARIASNLCCDPETLLEFVSGAKPQQEQLASYQTAPVSSDFTLSLNWSAQHAFRFMCGTQQMQTPYEITINNTTLLLTDVVSCSEAKNEESIIFEEDVVNLNFKSGSLRAHYLKTCEKKKY